MLAPLAISLDFAKLEPELELGLVPELELGPVLELGLGLEQKRVYPTEVAEVQRREQELAEVGQG